MNDKVIEQAIDSLLGVKVDKGQYLEFPSGEFTSIPTDEHSVVVSNAAGDYINIEKSAETRRIRVQGEDDEYETHPPLTPAEFYKMYESIEQVIDQLLEYDPEDKAYDDFAGGGDSRILTGSIADIETEMEVDGWFLEKYQRDAIVSGESRIEEIPIDQAFQWEYNPPLTKQDKNVREMAAWWKQTTSKGVPVKFAAIEGSRQPDGRVKVLDGQHRWLARKLLGDKRIKVLIT